MKRLPRSIHSRKQAPRARCCSVYWHTLCVGHARQEWRITMFEDMGKWDKDFVSEIIPLSPSMGEGKDDESDADSEKNDEDFIDKRRME